VPGTTVVEESSRAGAARWGPDRPGHRMFTRNHPCRRLPGSSVTAKVAWFVVNW